MTIKVDLVVNTFERTYRKVLASGFFPMIVEQNRFSFAREIALINNVQDREDAKVRAEKLAKLRLKPTSNNTHQAGIFTQR